jgi:hypothetical protein
MKFANLFGRASSRWIKYSEYNVLQDDSGEWYVAPSPSSTPAVYDPIENAEQIVVDALNIGLRCISANQDNNRIAAEICVFAEKYGLLGFMTALPTTPEFMNYDTVYLPKNRHIRKESMPSKEYAKTFFPFDENLNVNSNPKKHYTKNDGAIMVSLAARSKPIAIEMCYRRGYAEPFDWLYTQFKDWAVLYYATLAHGEEKDPQEAEFYRDVIAAYDGNVPSFHIEIFDKIPTLVWDFHSLMMVIHLVFGLMITDDKQPLRSCKHCNRVFIAKHPKAEFCQHGCKNKYNVYKSRDRDDKIK